ncbi:MAG: hypothetical protein ACREK5_00540, partial [Gemmatimonadota bacterium]
ETLAALGEERLLTAIDALEEEFGDGGPWRGLASPGKVGDSPAGAGPPAWPGFVALALAPAAAAQPDGPWADLAAAWKERYAVRRSDGAGDHEALFRHPAMDESTAALLRAAAEAARRPGRNGALAGA